ncbi:hypothetical protein M8C21_022277, partial [Ambrosia artemisiifolia]
WIPELKHYAPGVPIVLVGTKMDLRDDKQFFADHPNATPITTAQGLTQIGERVDGCISSYSNVDPFGLVIGRRIKEDNCSSHVH